MDMNQMKSYEFIFRFDKFGMHLQTVWQTAYSNYMHRMPNSGSMPMLSGSNRFWPSGFSHIDISLLLFLEKHFHVRLFMPVLAPWVQAAKDHLRGSHASVPYHKNLGVE